MILRAVPFLRPLCIRFLTHYEVLGIPKTATKAEIKKAYLDKAKECHPDVNPDNDEAAIKFQQIQTAHDLLLSSKQRAQYNHHLNKEQYYNNSGEHQGDTRRRSNVRSHGVDSSDRVSEDFHENHRVNQDNYQTPGSQRKYYHAQESAQLESALLSQADVLLIIGLLTFGFFGYVVVRVILSTKEELETGRHNKSKTMAAHMAAARRAISSGWGGIYSDVSVSDRPSQRLDDTHKVVWDSGKEKLVRKTELSSTPKEDSVELSAEMSNVGKPLTLPDISLLRVEMSKKRSEYLAAKREYNEKLIIFNKEQEERMKKAKKVEEFI